MLVVSAAGIAAWLTGQDTQTAQPDPGAQPPEFALPAGTGTVMARSKAMPPREGWPGDTTDMIGAALDMKRVFDDFAGSTDPRQRRLAGRAYNACLPAFLPTEGQTASPENLIDALPADQHAPREAAYRALFARCHRMVSETRSSLDRIRVALASDAGNTPPGIRAQERLLAGETIHVEALVAQVLTSGDANEVADLAGIAGKLAYSSPSGATPADAERALVTDAALALVACDLGRDCTAQSLWALQLCATEGLCNGTVAERLVVRHTQAGIAPEAVVQRRVELLDAIRAGTAGELFRLPVPLPN